MCRIACFGRCDLPFTWRRVRLIGVCRRISMIVGMSTPGSLRVVPAV
ncbi:hypothetical protein ACH4SK_39740 [Streptomyces inhibens]